jgi:hypothetical protein
VSHKGENSSTGWNEVDKGGAHDYALAAMVFYASGRRYLSGVFGNCKQLSPKLLA